MYLNQLKVTNYKTFLETTAFNFEPGFNVLLGANSSGKTSVLEAISVADFQNTPHLSILNAIEIDMPLVGASATELRFTTSVDELARNLPPGTPFCLGLGDQAGHFYEQDPQVLSQRLQSESICLDFKIDHAIGQCGRLSFSNWHPMWRQLSSNPQFPALIVTNADKSAAQVTNIQNGSTDIQQLFTRTASRIYKFSSERLVQHIYGHQGTGDLLPNGENLAYCINFLQSGNPDLAKELDRLLHRVFPTIHWVGSQGNGNNQFELKVHTNPSQMKKSHLAIPINRVGTGVYNALAMLYVALTAQTQRFILLEEPNSFLHPRALRELLAILAEIGGKHQFFITTHSSDVLRTVKASTVTLLEYDGQQTTIKQTTGDKLHELQAGLIDLGISLTDLHGCDKVLWVEGETEGAVFPLLLRHFFPSLAQGIAVLPLHATGDFESRKFAPKKVVEIYRRLSQDSFLAPPMVAITLDREKKSQSEINQVEKDCAGVVHFLPTAMLEDYLLDADAIAVVLNRPEITSAEVEVALAAAQNVEVCLLHPQNKKSKILHAANVLKFVFDRLSNVEYHKSAHGPKITEWLIANKPEAFAELKGWFGKFLNIQK